MIPTCNFPALCLLHLYFPVRSGSQSSMKLRLADMLFAAAQAGVAVAGNLPRGVGPEFAKFYDSSKATFSCISYSSVVLAGSQINDGSCDCPDGSDEPGTPACAHIDPRSPAQPLPHGLSTTNTKGALPGFWCVNKGHVGAYLPFQHVNDGACDHEQCCDGSDEYGQVGGVQCVDKCGPIGEEYRKAEKDRSKARERAVKKRRTMVKEARELKRQVEANMAMLQTEVAEAQLKKDELEKKLRVVEASEKGKVVKTEGASSKLGMLVELAKARVGALRDALHKMLEQRDDLAEQVAELESILKKFKEEYNPNFNDEGVKAAVKGWEDYVAKTASQKKTDLSDSGVVEVLREDSESSGINWKEFAEEKNSDADIFYHLEAYLPFLAHDFVQSKIKILRIWLIEHGILADTPSSDGESRLVTAARKALQEAADQVSAKSASFGEQERDLARDYGRDDVFRALKGRCVSTDSGAYTYELCWLDKTDQKEKKGHGNTKLGEFARIERHVADDEPAADGRSLGKGERMVLKYENGQGCWNGPSRRTDVWLACAEAEEIWRVSEAEKCVYRMEVGTPAACEDGDADAVAAGGQSKHNGKDEL